MLKIARRTVPLEMEGELNRAKAELYEERNGNTAKADIGKGQYFILHDVCYQAVRVILKGTEIKPNDNCVVKSLNELGGN